MFKPDELIMERPKCQIDGCNKPGFCLLGGKLVCADCLMKFENKKNKIINEMIQNAD